MECEREGYYGLSHNTILTPFFAGSTSFLSIIRQNGEVIHCSYLVICFSGALVKN